MALLKYKLDIVNNYYAFLNEVTGDDANDGLTPETAVASMNRVVTILNNYAGALRRVAVIYAHRIFNQSISVVRNGARPITFDFVNRTVVDGSGANRVQFTVASDLVINATVINYAASSVTNSFTGVSYVEFQNCFLNNNTFGFALASSNNNNYSFIIKNSLILNSWLYRNGAIGIGFNVLSNCVLVNCFVPTGQSANFHIMSIDVINTIFQNCSTLRIAENSIKIDYCNIVDSLSGKTHLQWQSIGYNLSGLSINPQFNDTVNGVYTVRSTSPMLYRGENGQHIGIGEAIYVSATELFSLAETLDNLTLQSGKLIRPDDSSDALLETFMMSLGNTRSIDRVSLVAALAYVAAGISRSVAIDTEGYIAYDAGAQYHKGSTVTDSAIKYRSKVDFNTGNTPASSPTQWERMTWQTGVSYAAGKIVQYTDNKWYRANTTTSTTWVAGEWNIVVPVDSLNFGLKYGRTNSDAEAMDWEMFNFNQPLLVDSTGKGTANNDFNPNTGVSIRINFWKVRIMIKTVR